MPKDFIKIAGKSYRVEANWNAVVDFLAARGTNDLVALQSLERITPLDATLLLACCVKEGERLEGRECTFTAATLGEMRPAEVAACIAEFLTIYVKQSAPDTPQEEVKKKD